MGVELAAFLGVATLVIVTPGPDMALVTRTALAEGMRPALRTSAGICCGLLAWGALSALGVAAVVAASATAFTVLKLAGAAYLIYLGVQTIRGARGAEQPQKGQTPLRPGPARRAVRSGLVDAEEPQKGQTPLRHGAAGRAFRSGLVSNLLNPKIAVFYSTVLPGFVAVGADLLPAVLLLTGIHVSMSVIWLGGYAWAVTRAGDVLRRPRARRLLERVTGGVLVAFGARLALTSR